MKAGITRLVWARLISSAQSSCCRNIPHRRKKVGYKSPSTLRHSRERVKNLKLKIDNLETLIDFYSMDTAEEQFLHQKSYNKFERMNENGEALWSEVYFERKRIFWINPYNGLALAVLKEECEVSIPNEQESFDKNLHKFVSVWEPLDYSLEHLIENIRSHKNMEEYCCLNCKFPFSPVCSELYTKFEPG